MYDRRPTLAAVCALLFAPGGAFFRIVLCLRQLTSEQIMNCLSKTTIAALGLVVSTNVLAMDELHKKYACTACHADNKKLVGPAYQDVADKYRDAYKKDATATVAKVAAKVKSGGSGVFGPVPMPPHGHVPEADIQKMVKAVLDMPPGKR
jgi:cytochrome c